MNPWCQRLFFALIARPIITVVVGVNIRHGERLPREGPAILVANHNSHLDTVALMTIFPGRMLPKLRPVAAADYFLSNRLLAWFSRDVIGILPFDRQLKDRKTDPLAKISEALENGDIVILFPEGSRGEPEKLAKFKTGIAHLALRHPEIPVTPIFTHGLGKTLPRGECLPVPFFCDMFVGDPIFGDGDRKEFMAALEASMASLAGEDEFPVWD